MKNLFLALAFIFIGSIGFANEINIEKNEPIEYEKVHSLTKTVNNIYLLKLELGVLCVVHQQVPVATYGMVTHYETIFYVQWASSDDHCDLINSMVGQGMGNSSGN